MKHKVSIAILISCLVLVSFPTTLVRAASPLHPHLPAQVINEYEYLTELRAMSDAALLSVGFTATEISALRIFNFADHLRAVAKLPSMALRNAGYTNEQIQLFAKFDGRNDEHLRILSASLSLWAGFSAWHYEPNPAGESWVRLWVSWGWAGIPSGTLTDRLVLNWSHDFRLDRSPNQTHASVHYFYESVYEYWATETVAPTPDVNAPGNDTNAAEFLIRMRKGISGLLCRALSGTATVRVFDAGPKNSVNLFVSYGHRATLLAFEPGWSLSGPDVGITWRGFWVHANVDAGMLNLFTGAISQK